MCSQTQLDDVHEQIIVCRQLFAGHVVGFQPMKRTKNLHRMIMPIMRPYSLVKKLVVKIKKDTFSKATIPTRFNLL